MQVIKSTLLLLGASGLWLTMSFSSAANIQFSGVVPGTMINKNIISMREQHFVNMVPQQTDFSCGAAALATILNYAYNFELTEADVIEGMLKVSDPQLVQSKGFSLLDIKHYVETLGLRGRGYSVNPDILDRIKIPTIACWISGVTSTLWCLKPRLKTRYISLIRPWATGSWTGRTLLMVGTKSLSPSLAMVLTVTPFCYVPGNH